MTDACDICGDPAVATVIAVRWYSHTTYLSRLCGTCRDIATHTDQAVEVPTL